jgi:hypothetical protein
MRRPAPHGGRCFGIFRGRKAAVPGAGPAAQPRRRRRRRRAPRSPQGAPRKTPAARGAYAAAGYPAVRGGRGGRGAPGRGYADYSYYADPYAAMYYGYAAYPPRGRGYGPGARGGRGFGAGRGRSYVGPPPGQPGESSGLQVRPAALHGAGTAPRAPLQCLAPPAREGALARRLGAAADPRPLARLQVVVHNLPWNCTWQQLKDAFKEWKVQRADVAFDSWGRSR